MGVLAIAYLADSLLHNCPFSYGNTINFTEPIADDTRLDGFVVFAPWWSDRRTRAWTRAKTSRSLRREVSHVCQRATHYRRARP